MELPGFVHIILVAVHFVSSWVIVGAIFWGVEVNKALWVGFGLWIVVGLQVVSLLYYLKKVKGETMHFWLFPLAFLVLAFFNLLAIIVGVWAGTHHSLNYGSKSDKYKAAIAFGVFDFLALAGMIVFSFITGDGPRGGGYEPPVTNV